MKINKNGFTLIELVISILIIGIIGGGALEVILNIYKAYKYKYEVNKTDLMTLNSAFQISKLIENRIEGSIIVSKNSKFSALDEEIYSAKNGYILEWVGVDSDGLLGGWNSDYNVTLPAWSGFIDLDLEHNLTQIHLGKENNWTLESTIIKAFSNNQVDIFTSSQDNSIAIFFKMGNYNNPEDGFGWYDSNSSGAYKVYIKQNNFISVDTNFSVGRDKVIIYEQYQLSWSAFAISLIKDKLKLFYNYRPWNGDTYLDGDSRILLNKISNFQFEKVGSTVRFRICSQGICRESFVY